MNGRIDNPMTSMISWPQVLGHEVVGEIMNAAPSLGIERSFRRFTGIDLEELGEEWKEKVQERYLPQIPTLERPRRTAQALLNPRRTGGLAPVYVAPAPPSPGVRFRAQMRPMPWAFRKMRPERRL